MSMKLLLPLIIFTLTGLSHSQVDILWMDSDSLGIFNGIDVDSNDDIVIGGSIGYQDVWLRRYDSNGNHLWTKTYTGAYDVGNLVIDSDGYIYVSVASNTDFNMKVLKVSADGTFQWLSDSFTSDYSWPNDIALAPNGDVIAVGSDDVDDGWAVMRVSPAGSIIWQNSYNQTSSDWMIANGVTCDSDGNIIIAGIAGEYFATLKCDSAGNVLWYDQIDFAGIASVGASGVICDPADNIYVSGSTSLDDYMELVKYDPSGNLLFETQGLQHYANFDLVLYDDTTIVTAGGISTAGGGLRTDLMMGAFNPAGDSLFNYEYDIDYTDGIYRLALDSEGNITAVGQASTQQDSNVLIMKFRLTPPSSITEGNLIEPRISCYPNPANAMTMISLHLDNAAQAHISIYNCNGHLVETILNDSDMHGNVEVQWNTDDVPTGVYFVNLEAGALIQTAKVVVVH